MKYILMNNLLNLAHIVIPTDLHYIFAFLLMKDFFFSEGCYRLIKQPSNCCILPYFKFTADNLAIFKLYLELFGEPNKIIFFSGRPKWPLHHHGNVLYIGISYKYHLKTTAFFRCKLTDYNDNQLSPLPLILTHVRCTTCLLCSNALRVRLQNRNQQSFAIELKRDACFKKEFQVFTYISI